ncbi:MAG: pyridoxamine 5'-phosphate oxidase family protein [Proteobacteria bacterium]|nr:pyridoxamine 5'-phosphate oxidase family protein [Pseudomonadota bacterium]
MSNETTRLLDGAAKTMAGMCYCWLMTTAEDGIHARPMGRIPAAPGEDALTVRFLADSRSRKAAEIRRCGKVTAIYEDQPSDGYVAVTGTAILEDDPAVVRRRWKRGYEAYFPTEADRAHALFVEVSIERMELWIRGVTPEPFGMKPTVLERAKEGWRLVGS